MADVTFTISYPILVGSQKFAVRYRSLPAGSWNVIADQTNAPFTINGLAVGNYELEATLILADLTECTPVSYFFDVNEDFTCYANFAAEILADGNGQYYVHLTWDFPSPLVIPPCGFIIEYTNSSTSVQIPYPTGLSLSGDMNIPIPSNEQTNFKVIADLCNGIYKVCFDEDLEPASVPCTPMTNVVATLSPTTPSGYYSLIISYVNSSPATLTSILTWAQTQPVVSNPDVGSSPVLITGGAGNNGSFTVKVHPTPNAFGLECVQYKGTIFDACGVTHNFCAVYPTGCYPCG